MSIQTEHGNLKKVVRAGSALLIGGALGLPGRSHAETPVPTPPHFLQEAPLNHTFLSTPSEIIAQSDWEPIPVPIEAADFADHHSRVYSNESFPHVDSNGVTTVIPAANGDLLIGRSQGMDRVRVNTRGIVTARKSFTFPETLGADVMVHVGETPNGRIYMGGPNGFLELLPDGLFQRIAQRQDMQGNVKFGVFGEGVVMSDNTAIMYSENGETARWITPKSHPRAPQDEILTMTTDTINGKPRCVAIIREYTGSTDPTSPYDPSKRVDSVYEFSPKVSPEHLLSQNRIAYLSSEVTGFNAGNISQTRMTPDGSYMVFTRAGGGIYKIEVATGKLTQIVVNYFDDRFDTTEQANIERFAFNRAGELWAASREVQGVFVVQNPLTDTLQVTQMDDIHQDGSIANTYISSVSATDAGIFVGHKALSPQSGFIGGVLTQFTPEQGNASSIYLPFTTK